MKEFTSIEAFRHVIRSVKDYCKDNGKPLPKIEYEGTVKLHGTNAGTRVTEVKIQPQSRSNIIGIGNDNMGFAVFSHDKHASLCNLVRTFLPKNVDLNVTIFGEWIGPGIQKNVAVSQLKDKQFVIFKAYHEELGYLNIKQITENISNELLNELNSKNIYFINQIPVYEIVIDFANPEDSVNELDKLTLEVENECPWGKFHGVIGIGEGIVWQPKDQELSKYSNLWFKTKGLKHKNAGEKIVNKTPIDVAKIKSMKQFANVVLPDWRLEQGISEMQHAGTTVSMQNLGNYLKWVCQDVIKEESDVIAENNITWKEASKYVIEKAKDYYLNYVNNN